MLDNATKLNFCLLNPNGIVYQDERYAFQSISYAYTGAKLPGGVRAVKPLQSLSRANFENI